MFMNESLVFRNGKVTNYTHVSASIREEHFITKEPELAYYRDGKAQQTVFKGMKLEGGW